MTTPMSRPLFSSKPDGADDASTVSSTTKQPRNSPESARTSSTSNPHDGVPIRMSRRWATHTGRPAGDARDAAILARRSRTFVRDFCSDDT